MVSRRSSGVLCNIVLFSLLVFSCSADNMAADNVMDERLPVEFASYPADEAAGSAVILAYGTTFKSRIVDVLVSELTSRDLELVVDDIANWESYPAADYDAVILLSGIQAFRTLPEAARYIKSNEDAANIVYFFAYTGTEWPYGRGLRRQQIDAITSVSTPDDEDAVIDAANRIINRVDEIIGQ
jgi:hypothetical protein